jgi:two-component system, response regulator YesN
MYKVLIVDDEVLVRVGLKTTINWEANGFMVVAEASNGEQGYEQYKRHLPDVIITDIKMPRKDGLWLIEQVRKENRDINILVLTCHDEFSYARKALKYGVDDYILKSEVEDEELISVMQSIKKKLDAHANTKHIKDKDLTNRNDIKRAIFTDMIKFDFNLDPKLLERCDSIEFPLIDTKFAFVNISINDSIRELHTENNLVKQTNNAVLNIIFDLFTERSVNYIYTHQAKKYMFYLSSQILNGPEMKRMFISVSNAVKQYFDISLNIIFTEAFTDIESAAMTYKNFIEKSQILFYKNETSSFITCTDTISFNEPNVFYLKKQHNKRFIEAIGQENVGKTKELIYELGCYFEQNNVNPMIVKIFYSNLMGDIFNSYGLFLENNKEINNYEFYHYKIENFEHILNVTAMLTELIGKVIKEIQHIRYNNSKAMINQAVNYIQYHYDEKISLEDVAEKLNLSKHYLCSVFKKETGENMSLYINKLRIDKAKSMLLESEGRIKEIFEEVGYSNQQYFSKVFKKITGITVMEYKESRMHKE